MSTPTRADDVSLPAPQGPHAIGYWQAVLRTSRLDRLPSHSDEARTLLLEAWYPAAPMPATASNSKPYVSAAVGAAIAEDLKFKPGFEHEVTTHAFPGAPPASGRFPVIVFSHGLSWPVALYQTLTEDLASRGFVVIGINHSHDASRIELPDGRLLDLWQIPGFDDPLKQDLVLAEHLDIWLQDIEDVLCLIRTWAAPTSNAPLSTHIDVERIGLTGHSYGGSAVARIGARKELGISAVAAMEGQLRQVSGPSLEVGVPFMHLIGEYNRLELEGHAYLPSTAAPVYQVVIRGAGHAKFSDVIYLYKATTAGPDWIERHRHETEPERVLNVTCDYLSAFFDRYLRGKDSSLLHPVSYADRVAGPRPGGYPEAELTIDVK